MSTSTHTLLYAVPLLNVDQLTHLSVYVCVCSILPVHTCRYLYYFENDNPVIHVRYLSGLIALIQEQVALASGDGTQGLNAAADAHYKNTLGNNVCALHMHICVGFIDVYVCVSTANTVQVVRCVF